MKVVRLFGTVVIYLALAVPALRYIPRRIFAKRYAWILRALRGNSGSMQWNQVYDHTPDKGWNPDRVWGGLKWLMDAGLIEKREGEVFHLTAPGRGFARKCARQ